jgi:microcystin-dependent protein
MMLSGSIVMFAGSVAPEGWLLCDGSAVSRETYASLYSVIGDSYGSGDGSTTFNLPDLTGRVLIGSSSSHPAASRGGEENHGLILNELSEHSHSVPQHGHGNSFTASTPILSHSITQAEFTYAGQGNTQNTDKSTTSKRHFSGVTSTNATRSTDVAVSNHPSTDCAMSGSVNECQAFDTGYAGLGDQHSNMQPYITLNYIIYAGE